MVGTISPENKAGHDAVVAPAPSKPASANQQSPDSQPPSRVTIVDMYRMLSELESLKAQSSDPVPRNSIQGFFKAIQQRFSPSAVKTVTAPAPVVIDPNKTPEQTAVAASHATPASPKDSAAPAPATEVTPVTPPLQTPQAELSATHTIRSGEYLTRIANSKTMRPMYQKLEEMTGGKGKASHQTLLSILTLSMVRSIDPERNTRQNINAVDVGQKITLTETDLAATLTMLREAGRLDKRNRITVPENITSLDEILKPPPAGKSTASLQK